MHCVRHWLLAVTLAVLPVVLNLACDVTSEPASRSADPVPRDFADEPTKDAPRPNPELTPEQVVRIQLEALRNNDATDSGIAVAYRFASPENRRYTGPIGRFSEMLKGGDYASLLTHKEADFLPVALSDQDARQLVVVETAYGELVSFLFILSKQADGAYRDCWMTDAVLRGDLRQPDALLPINGGS